MHRATALPAPPAAAPAGEPPGRRLKATEPLPPLLGADPGLDDGLALAPGGAPADGSRPGAEGLWTRTRAQTATTKASEAAIGSSCFRFMLVVPSAPPPAKPDWTVSGYYFRTLHLSCSAAQGRGPSSADRLEGASETGGGLDQLLRGVAAEGQADGLGWWLLEIKGRARHEG